MAHQSDEAELVSAWAAMAAQQGSPGWSSIPIAAGGGRLRAGVRHPGNSEALLVGFGQIQVPQAALLPKGRGFVVTAIEPGNDPDRPHWFVLCREAAGSRELFERMAVDVVRTVSGAAVSGENPLFQIFLSRIRAWQNFMQRPDDALLSLEAQIGLVGELIILEQLVVHLPDALSAVEAWQGPLEGVQDFFLGHGSIEVKATTSAHGFPAKISSLEQLDQAVRRPVLLAAVRLASQSSGKPLPGWVDQLRAILGTSGARALFENRLLQGGYFDGVRDSYTVAFSHVSNRLMELAEDFPCLIRSVVPAAIVRATYEIDLDLAPGMTVDWTEALQKMGIS